MLQRDSECKSPLRHKRKKKKKSRKDAKGGRAGKGWAGASQQLPKKAQKEKGLGGKHENGKWK